MSEPSQEARGIRARASRWNARRRGRGTLKAAYTQAARDVKRMDPAVRERIGRANLTKSDLQQLAGFHVDAQFRPGRYGDMSQRLGQAANSRLQQAGPAPRQPRISTTRNPARALYNRYSRWGRNQRRGTKALKAALKQAARDVKRTDPAVQLAIGRSTLNSADLAALAAGRMDQVFRPEGRFQGAPGQQQQQGRGQAQGRGPAQGAGIQSPDAVRQGPAQSEQLTQRIIALQQSILENQQRQMTLMEENTRLQAEMRQMLEARVQQLEQQVAGGEQAVSPPELTQQPEIDPNRQSPEGQQPQRENTDDHVRLDNPVIPASEGPEGEQQSPGEAEAAGDPQARGEGEAERGDGEARGEGTVRDEAQAEVSSEEVTEQWLDVPGNPEASVDGPEQPGTQNDTEAETKQPAQAEQQQPGTDPQQPGVAPQEPAATGQQPGTDPQRDGVNTDTGKLGAGVGSGETSQEMLDAKFARDIATGGQKPLTSTTPQQTDGATKTAGEDGNRRQRGAQAPTQKAPSSKTKNTPSSKDGR